MAAPKQVVCELVSSSSLNSQAAQLQEEEEKPTLTRQCWLLPDTLRTESPPSSTLTPPDAAPSSKHAAASRSGGWGQRQMPKRGSKREKQGGQHRLCAPPSTGARPRRGVNWISCASRFCSLSSASRPREVR